MRMILECLVVAASVVFMGGYSVAAVTYYVDSVEGRNTASGRTSKAPWADFTNINGKVLQPGDRLLIKCGSVINQELKLQAQGSKKAWVEIGAYGKGTRPVIRRATMAMSPISMSSWRVFWTR